MNRLTSEAGALLTLSMRLQQGQVWKTSNRYVRIVALERLSVDYKMLEDIESKDGTHHHTTKKQFCRLIKGAQLVEELS